MSCLGSSHCRPLTPHRSPLTPQALYTTMAPTHHPPVALQAWQERILQAHRQGKTLSLRGMGSKDFFTHPRLRTGTAPLSTEGLGQAIEHEPSELFVRVQAGARLSQVQAVLDQAGQCLAFEPPSFFPTDLASDNPHDATVGGMVASGLSGPARVSSGSLRDHVLGVSLINGRAEYLQFGGQVMKNVAGYDVSRLLCGSWGMLGLITEVTFKVLPCAPCEESLQVRMSGPQALSKLASWATRAWPLNASVWAPSQDDDEHASQAPGLLTLRFRGAMASVKASLESLHAEFRRLGLTALTLSAIEASSYWNSVKDQQHGFFRDSCCAGTQSEVDASERLLWRLSLPLSEQHQGQPLPSMGPAFIEWHGALRWFWAPIGETETLQLEASRMGAQLTLWRPAPDVAPERLGPLTPFLRPPLSAASVKLHRQIQLAFDPKGVFNNGCLF